MVLMSRRWHQLLKKLSLLRGDGDNKPDLRGERRVSRKTIRAGNAAFLGPPVVKTVCSSTHKTTGVSERPAFPAPSDFSRDDVLAKTRVRKRRGNVRARLLFDFVIPGQPVGLNPESISPGIRAASWIPGLVLRTIPE